MVSTAPGSGGVASAPTSAETAHRRVRSGSRARCVRGDHHRDSESTGERGRSELASWPRAWIASSRTSWLSSSSGRPARSRPRAAARAGESDRRGAAYGAGLVVEPEHQAADHLAIAAAQRPRAAVACWRTSRSASRAAAAHARDGAAHCRDPVRRRDRAPARRIARLGSPSASSRRMRQDRRVACDPARRRPRAAHRWFRGVDQREQLAVRDDRAAPALPIAQRSSPAPWRQVAQRDAQCGRRLSVLAQRRQRPCARWRNSRSVRRADRPIRQRGGDALVQAPRLRRRARAPRRRIVERRAQVVDDLKITAFAAPMLHAAAARTRSTSSFIADAAASVRRAADEVAEGEGGLFAHARQRIAHRVLQHGSEPPRLLPIRPAPDRAGAHARPAVFDQAERSSRAFTRFASRPTGVRPASRVRRSSRAAVRAARGQRRIGDVSAPGPIAGGGRRRAAILELETSLACSACAGRGDGQASSSPRSEASVHAPANAPVFGIVEHRARAATRGSREAEQQRRLGARDAPRIARRQTARAPARLLAGASKQRAAHSAAASRRRRAADARRRWWRHRRGAASEGPGRGRRASGSGSPSSASRDLRQRSALVPRGERRQGVDAHAGRPRSRCWRCSAIRPLARRAAPGPSARCAAPMTHHRRLASAARRRRLAAAAVRRPLLWTRRPGGRAALAAVLTLAAMRGASRAPRPPAACSASRLPRGGRSGADARRSEDRVLAGGMDAGLTRREDDGLAITGDPRKALQASWSSSSGSLRARRRRGDGPGALHVADRAARGAARTAARRRSPHSRAAAHAVGLLGETVNRRRRTARLVKDRWPSVRASASGRWAGSAQPRRFAAVAEDAMRRSAASVREQPPRPRQPRSAGRRYGRCCVRR